jgi:hypothetical protein
MVSNLLALYANDLQYSTNTIVTSTISP